MIQQTSLVYLKKAIIEACVNAGEGHIPSALSVLDIIWVAYKHFIRFDPKNQHLTTRDYFILSKGHSSLALYAVLADAGFFPMSDLQTFGRIESSLGGHPDCLKVPGVEVSTGSLGHGISMAVGVALGLKIDTSKQSVFCLIGDGECNEGSVWESALLASHHNLSNLTVIIDDNNSCERSLRISDIGEKFRAFGWSTLVVNGHDHMSLFGALSSKANYQPRAIIAKTIKGNGCKVMENNPAWHHRVPNLDELKIVMESLT